MKSNLKFCSTWYAFALTLFGISFHTFDIIVWQVWLLGIEFIVPISRLKKIEFSILKNPNWHIHRKKIRRIQSKPQYIISVYLYISLTIATFYQSCEQKGVPAYTSFHPSSTLHYTISAITDQVNISYTHIREHTTIGENGVLGTVHILRNHVKRGGGSKLTW